MKWIRWSIFVILRIIPVNVLANDFFQFIKFKNHSRFIFKIQPNIEVQFSKTQTGFELFLKGVSLHHLDQSVFQNSSSKKDWYLKKVGDERVKNLQFELFSGG